MPPVLPAPSIRNSDVSPSVVNVSEPAVAAMESILGPLVANFERLPVDHGRKMRELLGGNPAAFQAAAVRVLNDVQTVRARRHLVAILLDQELLSPILLDLTVSLGTCLAVARIAVSIDRQFHLWLSSLLQKGMLDSEDMPMEVAARLLAILNATMEPNAVSPLLRKILLHPNARVRSKATLLIGRGKSAIEAIENFLVDNDPRVRANAVEALWANPDARVLPIFVGALEDSNNRVVGNAIFGLHTAGSMKAIAAAFTFAQHERSTFRGSAAWAMGKTGDPRFLPCLGRLLGKSSGQLRGIVFQALQSAKKSFAARTEALGLGILSHQPAESHVEIYLTVNDSQGRPVTDLSATRFVLRTASELILDVEYRAETEADLFLGCIVPAVGLGRESTGDVPILASAAMDGDTPRVIQYDPEPPSAHSHHKTETGEPKLQLIAAIHASLKPPPELSRRRSLIVLVAAHLGIEPREQNELIAVAVAANCGLHVLSFASDPAWERIGMATSGSFSLVAPNRIQHELTSLSESLQCVHVLRLPAQAPDNTILLQVYTGTGFGETSISPPAAYRKGGP